MLGSPEGDDKVFLAAGISRDLGDRGLDARELISGPARLLGGGGSGGRPDLAQAGGKHPAKLDEALTQARADIRQQLEATGSA